MVATASTAHVGVFLHACVILVNIHPAFVRLCLRGGFLCVFFFYRLQVDYTHTTDQTSQATMDSVWMKNASVPFTYSSRRKIFLQGCPPETWRSHARRPAATLPTRFSIKQANNTIPTPINKWSFLNKVLYTEPLTEATHHNLMGPCTGQSYFSPSLLLPSLLYLRAEWASNGGSWNRRLRGAFRSSSCHHLAQHWLRYSTICFMIYEAINMRFPPPLFLFFPSRLFHERTHKKHKYLHASTHKLPHPHLRVSLLLLFSLSEDRLFTAVWTFRALARQMLGRLSTRCYC